MSDLVEFLLARIAEDEAATFELVPYACPPGCCAPAGFVGHRCLICGVTEFGGTVETITSIAHEHEEQIHRRSRVLAECEAKRRIIELHSATDIGWGPDVIGCATCDDDHGETWGPDLLGPGESLYPCPTIRLLALPYADHPEYRAEWRP